jgi:hypothetical protein
MSNEFYRKQTENQHEKFVVLTEAEVQTEAATPSRYYVVNAFGDYIFVKVRGKAAAQKIIDECYGKGFYKIRAMGLEPITGKDVSARP